MILTLLLALAQAGLPPTFGAPSPRPGPKNQATSDKLAGRLLIGGEVELYSPSARISFTTTQDFKRYLETHPEARDRVPDQVLLASLASPAQVLAWPSPYQGALRAILKLPSGAPLSESTLKKQWESVRRFWSSLEPQERRALFDPEGAPPAILPVLATRLADQAPRIWEASEIHPRADLDPETSSLLSRFILAEDGKKVLEVKHESPVASVEQYLDDLRRLGKVIGVGDRIVEPHWDGAHDFSLHTHATASGVSLRSRAALLNLALASENHRQKSGIKLLGNRNVALAPVEFRGIVRLFQPDRVETRLTQPGAKGHVERFAEAVLRPGQVAAALASGDGLAVIPDTLPLASLSDRSELFVQAISESLAAMERFCQGCAARNTGFIDSMKAVLEDDDSPFARKEAAYLLAHLRGLPTELEEKARSITLARLDAETPRADRLARYVRIPDAAIRRRVLDLLKGLPLDHEMRFLGGLTDLDHPSFEPLVEKALADAAAKSSPPPEVAFLARAAIGYPGNPAIRQNVVRLLRSRDALVSCGSAQALAIGPRFLDDRQASELAQAIIRNWNQPERISSTMKNAVATSGDPRLVLPLLDQAVLRSDGISFEAFPAALKSSVAVLGQERLAGHLKKGPPWRARALSIAQQLSRTDEPLQEAIGSAFSQMSRHEQALALRALQKARRKLPASVVGALTEEMNRSPAKEADAIALTLRIAAGASCSDRLREDLEEAMSEGRGDWLN